MKIKINDNEIRKRTTWVVAIRCGEDHPDGGTGGDDYMVYSHLLTPFAIPNHSGPTSTATTPEERLEETIKYGMERNSARRCIIDYPADCPPSSSETDCDCNKRKVAGMHACHWNYVIEDLWEGLRP